MNVSRPPSSRRATSLTRPAANAGLYPYGMTFDSLDNLYMVNFGDNDILKFDPAGNASLFADLSDGLNAPVDIVFDGTGNLLVLNLRNDKIQRLDLAGNGSFFANTGMDHPESMTIYVVPEPGCAALLLAGGLLCVRRMRFSKKRYKQAKKAQRDESSGEYAKAAIPLTKIPLTNQLGMLERYRGTARW